MQPERRHSRGCGPILREASREGTHVGKRSRITGTYIIPAYIVATGPTAIGAVPRFPGRLLEEQSSAARATARPEHGY